jgi:hypothetical protein
MTGYLKSIKLNLDFLLLDQKNAFVSGAHQVFTRTIIILKIVREEINENHYCRLLEGIIGMHATVMYQRWVLTNLCSIHRSHIVKIMTYILKL